MTGGGGLGRHIWNEEAMTHREIGAVLRHCAAWPVGQMLYRATALLQHGLRQVLEKNTQVLEGK